MPMHKSMIHAVFKIVTGKVVPCMLCVATIVLPAESYCGVCDVILVVCRAVPCGRTVDDAWRSSYPVLRYTANLFTDEALLLPRQSLGQKDTTAASSPTSSCHGTLCLRLAASSYQVGRSAQCVLVYANTGAVLDTRVCKKLCSGEGRC